MPIVLVVEDEVQVRMLAESVLEAAGYEVLSAGTLLEAQALIETDQRIDGLLLDIMLMDEPEAGLQLAQQAATTRPGLPVLYTTGRGVTDGMVALFTQPYVFLAKPYTGDQLVTAVADLLRRT